MAGEPGDELVAGDEEAGGGFEGVDGAGGFDGGEGDFEECCFAEEVAAAEIEVPEFKPHCSFEDDEEAGDACVHLFFGKELGVACADEDFCNAEKVFEVSDGHSIKELGVGEDGC